MATVVISGNGEIGSAVASALHRAGHRVVVQHEPSRAATLEERGELGGVLAKRARRLEDLERMVSCGRAIAVAAEPLQRVIDAIHPQLVLDAAKLGVGKSQHIADTVLEEMATKGLGASRSEDVAEQRAWKPFGTGALIGYLGGLIGLGGAEFRLPALVGWFGMRLRVAIAANLLISLATVVSALIARAAQQEPAALLAYAVPAASLALGSIAGAYVGASIAAQVKRRMLHRIVGILLAVLSLVMVLHGVMQSASSTPLIGVAAVAAGFVAGLFIGVVSSLLGVAGGELLIPTFVLLFGAGIKLAGTLSLAVSAPTLLVALWRLRGTPVWHQALARRGLVLYMAVGSMVGALLGSLSFGAAPVGFLSVLLAAILAVSAVKLYRG